jgi:CxxC motif-containing protein
VSEQLVVELICIGCPRGCPLKVRRLADGGLDVEGATCKRGKVYARAEITDPRRTLTASVRVNGGELPVVSVRSAQPVPRARIAATLSELRGITLDAPVAMHQMVLAQAAGEPIAIVTTRPIQRRQALVPTPS